MTSPRLSRTSRSRSAPGAAPSPGGAMDAAMRMLARRALSEEEIRGKLEKKGYPGGEAESVVARLRELGLADDSGLCGRLAAQYRETRGYGPAKIAWTLKRRGFPRDLVEETVRRSFPGEDELEAAAAALRKKFRGVPPPGREGAVRAYRFLAGRGFSPGVCRMAAGRWMKDFLEGED